MINDTGKALLSLFRAAVAAADPLDCLPRFLPPYPKSGRVFVAGLGKAAARMAQAVEIAWPQAQEGLIVTRYGHELPLSRLSLLSAGHPVPDHNSFEAGERLLKAAHALNEGDLFLLLLSGGGSALAEAPVDGVAPEDIINLTQRMLRSGMTIDGMNAVRKHVSRLKGGGLARAAWPARVLTLAISDVPGDDPAVIASGPTVADPTRFSDAQTALRQYEITPPPSIADHLARGRMETLKPSEPFLGPTAYHLIATPRQSLERAGALALSWGWDVLMLGDDLEGEARDLGAAHARLAMARRDQGWRGVILSGGETTVTLPPHAQGRGGRNGEYLLGFVAALDRPNGISALACDTDGIDGSGDNAGAIFSWEADPSLDPLTFLARHDSYGFFDALKGLVLTGPTHTNVNDFRAISVGV